MKCLFVVVMFLIASCIAGAQGAEFITFDNPGLSREERMIKRQVEKHTKSRLSIIASNETTNKDYIFNGKDAGMTKEKRLNM